MACAAISPSGSVKPFEMINFHTVVQCQSSKTEPLKWLLFLNEDSEGGYPSYLDGLLDRTGFFECNLRINGLKLKESIIALCKVRSERK